MVNELPRASRPTTGPIAAVRPPQSSPIFGQPHVIEAQEKVLRHSERLVDSLRRQEAELQERLNQVRRQRALLTEQIRVSHMLLGVERVQDDAAQEYVVEPVAAAGLCMEASGHPAMTYHVSPHDAVTRLRIEGKRPLPKAAGLKREADPESSVYRAALALRAAGRGVRVEYVLRVFREMGWVEGTWRDPRANVAQAVRRAVEYGWATRCDEDPSLFRFNYSKRGGEPVERHTHLRHR